MMDARVPGECNCARCQFIVKACIFVQETDIPFEMVVELGRFDEDFDLSDVEFMENMDRRATVHLEPHRHQWQ